MKHNIVNLLPNIKGSVRCILRNVFTGIEYVYSYNNLFVNVGKIAILRRLANIGSLSNEGMATYGATGTNTTTPSATDTKLGTELARKLIASASHDSGNRTCTIRTFFTTAESNGSLKEFGLFGEEATGTADTGTLFNHVVIDVTKDNTKTLTIEVVFEFIT